MFEGYQEEYPQGSSQGRDIGPEGSEGSSRDRYISRGPVRGVILRDNTKKGETITCLSIDRQEMILNISCFNVEYIVKLELHETTGLK